MRKLLFLVPIGLLAFWMGGCGSDSGSNQASPTPSPAASGASPSPVATATGSPTATPSPAFASPLVTPKSTGATAATGLIQSTNPDERARQAQSGISKQNGSRLPSPPISTKVNPNQVDPFSVLPPQTVQNIPGTNVASSGGNVLPKLPDRQVPLLPALPVSTRPPQIGGAKLTGANAGPIRLSPLAQSVVNEFSTFDSLLDDSTKYSDYTKDLNILRVIIYGEKENDDGRNSTRRQLLLTNRPLFRRLEKALGEYEYAQKLWNLYGTQSPIDAIRCSVVGDIEQAIQIYRPRTERRGELSCAQRLNMLQAVWRQGKLIVDAARRDQDYQGPTIARSPVLPVLSESKPLTSDTPQEKALGREIASLPQVPIQTPPQLSGRSPAGIPLLPGGNGAGTSTVPQLPGLNPPPLGVRRPGLATGLGTGAPLPPLPVAARPLGVPDLPELPVDKRPPQWVDPNPPRQRPGPVVPPPPDTGIASGIEVSGVVKVGNEIQVIVKVPTEATSRYVKVGQRLANGQVLVKRVEIKPGQDPIVFLEQSGVEIARVVGEKPVNSPGNSTNSIVRKPDNNNRATRR
ncbi:hypothetical protein [Kamptonema sp. UHCC 0994]|uniref:hypothetical protein n=1 Tax=Kamptonema sp. UHCC 0994 TaxID=3031329 RepID=UPI0023B8F692|nr:hypothetical protein [Kamptonema sp. UHCC 0994]MDF0552735.1 hypothetical protein [Kamptonema sp. UHCC 0994]